MKQPALRGLFTVRLAAFGILTISLIACAALGVPSDKLFHDRFLRFRSPEPPQAGVVIWNLDPESENLLGSWPFANKSLDRLAAFIAEAAPLQVIAESGSAALSQSSEMPDTIPLIDAGPRFFDSLWPDNDGTYRNFPLTVGFSGLAEPSAAVEAASRIWPELADGLPRLARVQKPPQLDHAPVNFSGVGMRYPTIQIHKLLDGQFDPQIFNGLTILIGRATRELPKGLTTPIWSVDGAMPRVEYLAEAITSLASDKWFSPTPFALDLVIVWLLAFYLFIAKNRLSYPAEIGMAGVSIVLVVLVQFFLFSHFAVAGSVALPIWFLLTTTFVSLSLRLSAATAAASELASSLAFRADAVTFSTARHMDSEEIWSELEKMSLAYFEPEFQAFFEIDPSGRNVVSTRASGRKVQGKYFHFSPLTEVPFSDAVAWHGPKNTPVPGTDLPPDLFASYLTPLRCKGRVVGFWALALSTAPSGMDQSTLARVVSHLALKMAERIAGAKPPVESGRTIIQRIGRSKIESRIEQADRLAETFEKGERFLNQTLSQMRQGVLLVGLSGRLVFFNDRAAKDLRRFGRSTAEPDFFAAIQAMAGARPEIFRERMLDLLASSEPLQFKTSAEKGLALAVTIQPVIDANSGGPDAFLVTLAELSESSTQQKLESRLLDAFFGAIRTIVEGIAQTGRTPTKDLSPEAVERLASVTRSAEQVLSLLRRYERHAADPSGTEMVLVAPLNIIHLVRQVVTARAGARSELELQFDLDLPDREITILGNQTMLTRVMESLLEISVAGSSEGGTITVGLDDVQDRIALRIEDAGAGLPDRYVMDPKGKGELADIRTAVEQVGGTFTVDSNLGRGTSFEITLPKVG
jgi:signal transduction histidine kinase/CHASE2 domain-containing sensor protein